MVVLNFLQSVGLGFRGLSRRSIDGGEDQFYQCRSLSVEMSVREGQSCLMYWNSKEEINSKIIYVTHFSPHTHKCNDSPCSAVFVMQSLYGKCVSVQFERHAC